VRKCVTLPSSPREIKVDGRRIYPRCNERFNVGCGRVDRVVSFAVKRACLESARTNCPQSRLIASIVMGLLLFLKGAARFF